MLLYLYFKWALTQVFIRYLIVIDQQTDFSMVFSFTIAKWKLDKPVKIENYVIESLHCF